jgi:hypothetical protein
MQRMLGRRRLQRAQPLKRLCQLDAALRQFTNIVQPSAKRIPFEEADLWDAGAHADAMTNQSPRPPCWERSATPSSPGERRSWLGGSQRSNAYA